MVRAQRRSTRRSHSTSTVEAGSPANKILSASTSVQRSKTTSGLASSVRSSPRSYVIVRLLPQGNPGGGRRRLARGRSPARPRPVGQRGTESPPLGADRGDKGAQRSESRPRAKCYEPVVPPFRFHRC